MVRVGHELDRATRPWCEVEPRVGGPESRDPDLHALSEPLSGDGKKPQPLIVTFDVDLKAEIGIDRPGGAPGEIRTLRPERAIAIRQFSSHHLECPRSEPERVGEVSEPVEQGIGQHGVTSPSGHADRYGPGFGAMCCGVER